MQAAQKKRLEEKNSKLIRELASIPANRNCFECGQRGPTYVNITEGSFCCTQCSGILRGLNPPHRVKSISMAAFTTDEVEKLGRLGNAENAKTWLGLYGGTPPAMTNRDAIQTFLVKKYEQKAWYLSKAELSEQERLMNQAKETASRTSSHGTGSVTSTTTNRPSNFDLLSDGNAWPLTDRSKPIITEPQPTGQAFSPPGFLAPPPPLSFDLPAAKPAPSAPNADLFGLFDSPRAPSDGTVAPSAHLPTANTSFINSQPSQIDPFADFDKKFSDLSVRPSNTVSGFNGLANQSVPVIPKSATVVSGLSGVLQPMPTTVPAPNPFQINMAPMQPAQVSAPLPSTASAPVVPESSGDKYSALAELDELFHHTPSTNDGKPSWMPTGFSTGIPPSATTGNLNLNGTPKQQPARALVGSFPKSQTMHGISDFSGNNPFLQNSSQPFSQAAFPNPFGPPPAQGQYAVPPQMMMQPTQQQNWGMSQPIIPPRPTSSSTAATPNWNPFL